MTVIIHGTAMSTCTRRVAVVLNELGVDYTINTIGVADIKTPEYLETKQPFGQMPVLEDDGILVYESRAVGRFLVHKYGSTAANPLIPPTSDLAATARFEIAASIETANFDTHASAIWKEAYMLPKYRGLPVNEAKVQEQVVALDGRLQGYERILSKSKYLAGNNITLADLFHLPYGHGLIESGQEELLHRYPHVSSWWKDISSRPSWLKAQEAAAAQLAAMAAQKA